MTDSQTTIPTPEDISIARCVEADASNGETAVSDGSKECSDCENVIPSGEPMYWTLSQDDPDPLCGACVISWAKSNQKICDALVHGEEI